MRNIIICLILLGLAGCGGLGPADSVQPGTPSVSGTWSLSHAQLANSCTDDSDLFPVAPGDVRLEQRAGEVTFISTDQGPRTYTAEPGRWTRQLRDEVETCAASLTETWRLHGVSQGRLSATYESRLELAGDCDFTGLRSCAVRYAVSGVRP